MITIAEATHEAINLALSRHRCRQLAQRRPPFENASAEAVALAGELARTLDLLTVLRGTRRDVRGYRARVEMLTARLTAIGVALPVAQLP